METRTSILKYLQNRDPTDQSWFTPMIDYWDQSSYGCMAMIRVPGVTLKSCPNFKPQIVPLLYHLQTKLHETGIKHRDLTDTNLLVVRDPKNESLSLVLLDFCYAIQIEPINQVDEISSFIREWDQRLLKTT